MATFVLIPGAGGSAWSWHLVEARLRELGHDTVACQLPATDDGAGLAEYVDAVMHAIGERRDRDDIVVVGHSLGAFTALLVTQRVDVKMLVLVAAMVPSPPESPGDWWANTGHDQVAAQQLQLHGWDIFGDPEVAFVHDVPSDLAEEAGRHAGVQSGTPFEKPLPMNAWPDVPTRVLIGSNDRFFPADFQRRVTSERLGITPDEIDTGHLPMLAKPVELADRLAAYANEIAG